VWRRDGNPGDHDAEVVMHGDAGAADTQFELFIVQRLTAQLRFLCLDPAFLTAPAKQSGLGKYKEMPV